MKPGSKRPYRLWDAKKKTHLRWRCYVYLKKAHLGALIECRWAQVGTTIEVYDITNGKLHGQYIRRVNHIDFKEN